MLRTLLLALALAGAAGCGREAAPLPMATTPEAARAALVAALDALKAGATADDLAKRSPPVFYRDDVIRPGVKLLSYAVDGEPKPVGTGMSFAVTLTTTAGTRKLGLRVVTDPNTSITKEDGPQ